MVREINALIPAWNYFKKADLNNNLKIESQDAKESKFYKEIKKADSNEDGNVTLKEYGEHIKYSDYSKYEFSFNENSIIEFIQKHPWARDEAKRVGIRPFIRLVKLMDSYRDDFLNDVLPQYEKWISKYGISPFVSLAEALRDNHYYLFKSTLPKLKKLIDKHGLTPFVLMAQYSGKQEAYGLLNDEIHYIEKYADKYGIDIFVDMAKAVGDETPRLFGMFRWTWIQELIDRCGIDWLVDLSRKTKDQTRDAIDQALRDLTDETTTCEDLDPNIEGSIGWALVKIYEVYPGHPFWIYDDFAKNKDMIKKYGVKPFLKIVEIAGHAAPSILREIADNIPELVDEYGMEPFIRMVESCIKHGDNVENIWWLFSESNIGSVKDLICDFGIEPFEKVVEEIGLDAWYVFEALNDAYVTKSDFSEFVGNENHIWMLLSKSNYYQGGMSACIHKNGRVLLGRQASREEFDLESNFSIEDESKIFDILQQKFRLRDMIFGVEDLNSNNKESLISALIAFGEAAGKHKHVLYHALPQFTSFVEKPSDLNPKVPNSLGSYLVDISKLAKNKDAVEWLFYGGISEYNLFKNKEELNPHKEGSKAFDLIRMIKDGGKYAKGVFEASFPYIAQEFKQHGYTEKLKIYWKISTELYGSLSPKNLMKCVFQLGLSNEQLLEFPDTLKNNQDLSKYFVPQLKNYKKLSKEQLSATMSILSALPVENIVTSPQLIHFIRKQLSSPGSDAIKYNLMQLITHWVNKLQYWDRFGKDEVAKRRLIFLINVLMTIAEQTQAKEIQRAIWRNLAVLKKQIPDKKIREKITRKAIELFTKKSPPWEKWLNKKINPSQTINTRLYIISDLDSYHDLLLVNDFNQKENIYSRKVGPVTLRIEFITGDLKDKKKVDVLRDLSDPKIHFIVYNGHSGFGGNVLMYHTRDENKPLEHGSKVIFFAVCNSMSSYFAQTMEVAPNSQFVGTDSMSDSDDDAIVFLAMLLGVNKDWKGIKSEVDRMKKEINLECPGDFNTNYLMPDDLMQVEKYGVVNPLDVSGDDNFEFQAPDIDLDQLNGRSGAKLALSAHNVMVVMDWHGISGIQLLTRGRRSGFDGEYFIQGESKEVKSLSITPDIGNRYHIKLNAGYEHLSQKAMTVLIAWKMNEYLKKKKESLEENKLRGLKLIVDFLDHHSPHELLWLSFKVNYQIPERINFEEIRELIKAEDDKQTEEAARLRKIILEKLR